MKAVVCRSHDGLDAARLEDVPPPALPDDGVRIRVRACAASFASLLVMQGRHQNRAEPPFIPGTEVAGEVLEAGPRVRHFRPGDRVIAGVRAGGYAEQVVAPESGVFELPDGIDYDSGAHFPTIYGTAFAALRWRAGVQPDDWVLVHGAAGGSGLAAVQVARACGARVIATAGSQARLELCARHGASHVLDYTRGDWRTRVLEITGGRGADIVFDPVGGDVFDQSVRCTAPDGRILVIGFASGTIPTLAAGQALVRNIGVLGVYWGHYMGWGRIPPAASVEGRMRSAFATLFSWALEGRIRPHTHRVCPLAEFRAALRELESRQVMGRIVMRPSGP